jgi:hypothetical protein
MQALMRKSFLLPNTPMNRVGLAAERSGAAKPKSRSIRLFGELIGQRLRYLPSSSALVAALVNRFPGAIMAKTQTHQPRIPAEVTCARAVDAPSRHVCV